MGGLIATLLVYVGVLGLQEGPGSVTINESRGSATPEEGVNPGGGDGTSGRDVYARDGPGVVTVDVGSTSRGPGGG